MKFNRVLYNRARFSTFNLLVSSHLYICITINIFLSFFASTDYQLMVIINFILHLPNNIMLWWFSNWLTNTSLQLNLCFYYCCCCCCYSFLFTANMFVYICSVCKQKTASHSQLWSLDKMHNADFSSLTQTCWIIHRNNTSHFWGQKN